MGVLINRVGVLAKAPRLLVHDLTAVFGDDTLEFVSDFLHLCIGQNRRDNENGLVIVHNAFNKLIKSPKGPQRYTFKLKMKN